MQEKVRDVLLQRMLPQLQRVSREEALLQKMAKHFKSLRTRQHKVAKLRRDTIANQNTYRNSVADRNRDCARLSDWYCHHEEQDRAVKDRVQGGHLSRCDEQGICLGWHAVGPSGSRRSHRLFLQAAIDLKPHWHPRLFVLRVHYRRRNTGWNKVLWRLGN